MVVLAFLLVAKLVAMQRAEIIAELADRVAHRDTADASAAVRQLADEARQAINKLLRRCQRQLERGERARLVSNQLTELSEALAGHCEQFSPTDHEWLMDTTHMIIKLANQIPDSHSPALAASCDAVIAALGTATPTDSRLVKHVPTSAAEPTNPAAHPDAAAEQPAEEPIDASWRTNWANPVFRMLPPTPIDAAPIERRPNVPAPSPSEAQPPENVDVNDTPLARIDSHTLFQRWRSADAANKTAIERQLSNRGFRQLNESLVQKFTSSRADVRLTFVDDLLATPGIDARPWLMLLAEDRDADVRLAAVTIMATSNDKTLVDKAWETAIRDRDPRIAELAERLRERRAATQRR
jgi:hypothetical protein